MNQYEAEFQVGKQEDNKLMPTSSTVTITVEAGNKRMASMRAIAKIAQMKEYADCYKTLKNIRQI